MVFLLFDDPSFHWTFRTNCWKDKESFFFIAFSVILNVVSEILSIRTTKNLLLQRQALLNPWLSALESTNCEGPLLSPHWCPLKLYPSSLSVNNFCILFGSIISGFIYNFCCFRLNQVWEFYTQCFNKKLIGVVFISCVIY